MLLSRTLLVSVSLALTLTASLPAAAVADAPSVQRTGSTATIDQRLPVRLDLTGDVMTPPALPTRSGSGEATGADTGDAPDPSTAPAHTFEWSVEWPDSEVRKGVEAVAYLHLPPTEDAEKWQMQRLIDGYWMPSGSYETGPREEPATLPFYFDTSRAGSARYRVLRSQPTPTVESNHFILTVTEPAPPPERGRATSVTVSTPAGKVKVGAQVVVTGKVTGPARPVTVQRRTATGWVDASTGTTNTKGRYRLRVPTDWYGRHQVRVHAPAIPKYKSGSSKQRTTVVRPRYRPHGSAKSWSALSGARWDPCRTITYKINATGAPKGAANTVKRAFAVIGQASGLRFKYAGTTTKVPFSGGQESQFEEDAILVAWATPKQVSQLEGSVLGIGGSSWIGYGDRDGKYVERYTHGGVTLDSTDNDVLKPGFGRGATLGALLLHEIGHAIGLGHVADNSQIMGPSLEHDAIGRFGAGDLAGLAALGASQGCLN